MTIPTLLLYPVSSVCIIENYSDHNRYIHSHIIALSPVRGLGSNLVVHYYKLWETHIQRGNHG